MYVVIVSGE